MKINSQLRMERAKKQTTKDIQIKTLMKDSNFYLMFDNSTQEMLHELEELTVLELFKLWNRNALEEKAYILHYFGIPKEAINEKIRLSFCEKILTYIDDDWFEYVSSVLNSEKSLAMKINGEKLLAKTGNNKSRFVNFSFSLQWDDTFYFAYLGYGERIIFDHFRDVARNIKMPCQLRKKYDTTHINSEWCDYACEKSRIAVKHFNLLLNNMLENI